jgi:hypothetical protein
MHQRGAEIRIRIYAETLSLHTLRATLLLSLDAASSGGERPQTGRRTTSHCSLIHSPPAIQTKHTLLSIHRVSGAFDQSTNCRHPTPPLQLVDTFRHYGANRRLLHQPAQEVQTGLLGRAIR